MFYMCAKNRDCICVTFKMATVDIVSLLNVSKTIHFTKKLLDKKIWTFNYKMSFFIYSVSQIIAELLTKN